MARVALGLDLVDLARLAGVGVNTVMRYENGMGYQRGTVGKLRRALEAAGIEFIPENGGGAGVRFRKPK